MTVILENDGRDYYSFIAWLHIPAVAARRNSVGEDQPTDQQLSSLSSSQHDDQPPLVSHLHYSGPPTCQQSTARLPLAWLLLLLLLGSVNE